MRGACTKRALGAVVLTVFGLAGCHRDPPATTRPGEIVPIDPAGLARLRAQADAGRPRAQPTLRVLSWNAVLAPATLSAASPTDLQNFTRSLERRLEMLDAWSPRAESIPTGARLSFALGRGSLNSLVREQLVRPGRIELVARVRCPKITAPPAIPGVDWLPLDGDNDITVPHVSPNVEGVAPLAPMRAVFAATPLTAPLRWAHGSIRAGSQVARRAFCVRADHPLPPPTFSEMRATMDPATLLPMLEVTLDEAGLRAYSLWLSLFSTDPPESFVLTVDDEVMGPITFTNADAGPQKLQIIPNSRMGSVSPELVGALWRSGPIALPFTVEDAAPPTQ